MSDDLTRRQPEDPTKVNINQQWEIDYWCRKFGVSEGELRQAIEKVGPMVKDVRQYLEV